MRDRILMWVVPAVVGIAAAVPLAVVLYAIKQSI